MTEESAVAEHAWDNEHSINWKEASIIDQARRHKELLLKEAVHTGTETGTEARDCDRDRDRDRGTSIHMTPADQCINQEGGLELLGCWSATLKRLQGGAGSSQLTPSGHVFPRVARL